MHKASALVLLSLVSGCSTVYNLEKDRAVYGGVGYSVEEIVICYRETVGPYACSGPEARDIAAYQLVFHLLELPWVAILDTVTLPVTVPASTLAAVHRRNQRCASESTVPFPSREE